MTQKFARRGNEPNPFIDPESYREELDVRERIFDLRVNAQKQAGR
jgi:hypothetical protein